MSNPFLGEFTSVSHEKFLWNHDTLSTAADLDIKRQITMETNQLSIYLTVHKLIYQYTNVFSNICLTVFLSVCLFACLSDSLSVSLSVGGPVKISLHRPFVCLSVCLFFCICFSCTSPSLWNNEWTYNFVWSSKNVLVMNQSEWRNFPSI